MKTVDQLFDPEENEVEEVELENVNVKSEGTSIDIADDYSFVREKLIKSMIRGSELIDEAVKEAKTTPTARAIEAASGAVKTLTDVSKGLIDLHEKIRGIEKERGEEDNSTDTLDNPKIVLKTTLSDLIKQIEEEETQ